MKKSIILVVALVAWIAFIGSSAIAQDPVPDKTFVHMAAGPDLIAGDLALPVPGAIDGRVNLPAAGALWPAQQGLPPPASAPALPLKFSGRDVEPPAYHFRS